MENRPPIDPMFHMYYKITDTMMYFDRRRSLQIAVKLLSKDKDDGKVRSYHNEYGFTSTQIGRKVVSIKRMVSYGLLINDSESYEDTLFLTAKDIIPLQFVLKQVMGWYVGDKRIYEIKDGKLVLEKNCTNRQFPINEVQFLEFSPVILEYSDGDLKEGLRMYINRYESFVDMSIDKFMEFFYYIMHVDIYNAALNMLNYVKTEPYGINYTDIEEKRENFFDKQD